MMKKALITGVTGQDPSRTQEKDEVLTTFKCMCGIVGYIGKRRVYDMLVEGLHRLEYRGYDSAGVAIVKNDGPRTESQTM